MPFLVGLCIWLTYALACRPPWRVVFAGAGPYVTALVVTLAVG